MILQREVNAETAARLQSDTFYTWIHSVSTEQRSQPRGVQKTHLLYITNKYGNLDAKYSIYKKVIGL